MLRQPAPTYREIANPLLAEWTCPECEMEAVRAAIVSVLKRAAHDEDFIARLTYQGSEALRAYNLTDDAKAALVSGDIACIEAYVGELDEELRTWFVHRLQQEIW